MSKISRNCSITSFLIFLLLECVSQTCQYASNSEEFWKYGISKISGDVDVQVKSTGVLEN